MTGPPPRSYTPIRRPGARVAWPPDDSWALTDLVAEIAFWRNYAALREFSGGPQPKPVFVPAQRGPRPHQDRFDALVDCAFGVYRLGRRPPGRPFRRAT